MIKTRKKGCYLSQKGKSRTCLGARAANDCLFAIGVDSCESCVGSGAPEAYKAAHIVGVTTL